MGILTLQPNATDGIDTHVSESSADSAYSTRTNLSIRGIATARNIALLKFDLAELAGATIESATLYLYGSGSGAGGTLKIHRILSANSGWVEGATWNYANPSSTRWAGDTGSNGGTDAGCSVSGTDWSATEMGSMAYSATSGEESSAALDLTEFGSMIASNYGMILKDAGTAATARQPCSSDNPTAEYGPKLVVEYVGAGQPTMARWRGIPGMTPGQTLHSSGRGW